MEEEKKKQKCLPKFSEIFLLQKESKFLLNLFEFFFFVLEFKNYLNFLNQKMDNYILSIHGIYANFMLHIRSLKNVTLIT